MMCNMMRTTRIRHLNVLNASIASITSNAIKTTKTSRRTSNRHHLAFPNETYYQRIVERHLGSSHMKLQHCITDITTESAHAEIKRWTRFAECIGQLMTYQIQHPRAESHAYMFDDSCGPSKIDTAIKTMKVAIPGIKLYTFRARMSEIEILELDTQDVVYREELHH